jgi:multicomponent Na+:H+ antiporter subunit D
MAYAQDHLKRMLAFVTIGHVGLFLAGVAMLSVAGVGAIAVYVVADGCTKAALFACVGIVQRRLGHVRVSALRGRGRGLRFTGAAFVLAALISTGLPLTGAFLGKALLDDALTHGVGAWASVIAIGATALIGATLLRAAGCVFLGWRRGAPAGDYEPLTEPQASTPVRMWAPIVVLLATAIAIGIVPGVRHAADVAAHGATGRTGSSPAPPAHDYVLAVLTVATAIGLAAFMLGRDNLPRLTALRAIHSGRLGDYVALLCAGAAIFGGAFAVALGAGG